VHGKIAPGHFISVAEDTGLIVMGLAARLQRRRQMA
jgi:EAL domain-containing protein (putative c-di-GMP-specific phosphodiesterase class I)